MHYQTTHCENTTFPPLLWGFKHEMLTQSPGSALGENECGQAVEKQGDEAGQPVMGRHKSQLAGYRHVWSLCRSYLRCQLKFWGVLPSWGCGFRCDTCCMCRERHFAEAACLPPCAVAEQEGAGPSLERGRQIWSEFVICVGPVNPDPICGLYVRDLNACREIEFLLHPPLLAGGRGSDSR